MMRGLIVVMVLIVSVPSSFAADKWGAVAESIGRSLDRSLQLYGAGRVKEARAEVSGAYFDIFEGEGMEEAVAVHISGRRKAELEMMFASIRQAMSSGKPLSVVRERVVELETLIVDDAERLSSKTGSEAPRGAGGSAYQTMFNAVIIIMREGLEAILIISALVAYLVKTGRREGVRFIYYGCAAALAASVITAAAFRTMVSLGGADREALEGVTMILAAAVLFYVSYWLISKMEADRWHRYIKGKVDEALGSANLFALSAAAFLAVYREGAETILFYEALYSSARSGTPILAGFMSGALGLFIVFTAVRRYSVKIPLKPFFFTTSALLYYLAFSFAGKGIMELQEADWLPYTEMSWAPHIELFGIYPSREGILLQAIMLAALLLALGYWFAARRRGEGTAGGV